MCSRGASANSTSVSSSKVSIWRLAVHDRPRPAGRARPVRDGFLDRQRQQQRVGPIEAERRQTEELGGIKWHGRQQRGDGASSSIPSRLAGGPCRPSPLTKPQAAQFPRPEVGSQGTNPKVCGIRRTSAYRRRSMRRGNHQTTLGQQCRDRHRYRTQIRSKHTRRRMASPSIVHTAASDRAAVLAGCLHKPGHQNLHNRNKGSESEFVAVVSCNPDSANGCDGRRRRRPAKRA